MNTTCQCTSSLFSNISLSSPPSTCEVCDAEALGMGDSQQRPPSGLMSEMRRQKSNNRQTGSNRRLFVSSDESMSHSPRSNFARQNNQPVFCPPSDSLMDSANVCNPVIFIDQEDACIVNPTSRRQSMPMRSPRLTTPRNLFGTQEPTNQTNFSNNVVHCIKSDSRLPHAEQQHEQHQHIMPGSNVSVDCEMSESRDLISPLPSPSIECLYAMGNLSVNSPAYNSSGPKTFNFLALTPERSHTTSVSPYSHQSSNGHLTPSDSITPSPRAGPPQFTPEFKLASPALRPLALTRSMTGPSSYRAQQRSAFRPILDDHTSTAGSPYSATPQLRPVIEEKIELPHTLEGETLHINQFNDSPPPPRCQSVGPIRGLRRSVSSLSSLDSYRKRDARRRKASNPYTIESSNPESRNGGRRSSAVVEEYSQKLPTIKSGGSGMHVITPSTMAELVSGGHDDKFDEILIFDCRFDYEFIGGHIRGAHNVESPDALVERLFRNPPENGSRIAVIFHCEFSKRRGPRACSFVRGRDRKLHGVAGFPNLYYPELYLMEGGYNQFFEEFPALCEPKSYVSMFDNSFSARLQQWTAREKSTWGMKH